MNLAEIGRAIHWIEANKADLKSYMKVLDSAYEILPVHRNGQDYNGVRVTVIGEAWLGTVHTLKAGEAVQLGSEKTAAGSRHFIPAPDGWHQRIIRDVY